LRFAPNFTAYVLPPDTVSSISEDRKFFLHGELYCALATAIGKNGRAAPEIVRQLSKSSRPTRSTKRSRGWSTPICRNWSTHAFAAPSPDIGEPRPASEVAEQNLRNCPCGSNRSMSRRQGTCAALSNSVSRSPSVPKLTITLVNDYLDQRLAEMNGERVADKTPWLLVQLSGVFSLVGPCSSRARGACWTCLFDRMIRNREIKGFLEPRIGAGRSPYRRWSTTAFWTRRQFTSPPVEIRKRSPQAFGTDCRDHIATLT